MSILGIDYGRRKIGLAISEGFLSEPLKVIRYKKREEAFKEIKSIVLREKVEKIVIGISEGEMLLETKDFAEELAKVVEVPVDYQDETLSTYDAKNLSFGAGIKRKKRRFMEDSYSAALILESYLEKNPRR